MIDKLQKNCKVNHRGLQAILKRFSLNRVMDLSRYEVIEAANRAYTEEYGLDKVISLHGNCSIKYG